MFSTPPLTNTTYPFLVNLSTGLVFGESPILLITVSLVVRRERERDVCLSGGDEVAAVSGKY